MLLENLISKTGMIYGWIGRCAEPREAGIMGELIDEKLPIQYAKYSKQVLMEGEEPENFFWVGLGVDVQQDGIPGNLETTINLY